jgi:hypothetical protein
MVEEITMNTDTPEGERCGIWGGEVLADGCTMKKSEYVGGVCRTRVV